MLVPTLLASLALTQAPKPVTLSRVFLPNQHYVYDVKSHLGIETRTKGLETFMPEDFDMNYTFTMDVLRMKADGIAVVRYQRPTLTQVQGETYESAPITKVEKVNLDYLLTLSPVNAVLEILDQKKPAPKKRAAWVTASGKTSQGGAIGQFISELYRLSLFVGSLDTALDVAPRLPFTEVKPGDTWQTTVGYQPQKLKDKSGKSEVQRLDYTYTYKGLVTVNGKPYQRVTAALDLNTDLAEWANQYIGGGDGGGEELNKLPLKLNAKIEFDLDPKTFNTVAARATSEGGFQIFLTSSPQEAVFERKLHGSTRLNLRSITTLPAKKPQ